MAMGIHYKVVSMAQAFVTYPVSPLLCKFFQMDSNTSETD
jgi:hypothetical protein